MHIKLNRISLLGLLVVMLCGCANLAPPAERVAIVYPESWQRVEQASAFDHQWLRQFEDQRLLTLIEQALVNNHLLQGQAARVEEFRQGVIVAGAARLPSLTAGLSGLRQKVALQNDTTRIGSNFQLGVNSQYEVDVWRRLSDIQRRAQLFYRAEQFDYEASRLQLVSNVTRTWFGAIFAKQLSQLFGQRVTNIEQNLEIIEAGYKQGINSALDVYLARTSAQQERSRLAGQQQVLLEQISRLQVLLAEYPDGQFSVLEQLPIIDFDVSVGLPSEVLVRRPDVQQSWTQLLAQNAGVAIAHKERFPSLRLSVSLDDGAGSFSDALDGNNLLWSLLGTIGQPLFQGGRLKAQEEQAWQQLKQAEQSYLNLVKEAFAEVENALSERRSLKLQLDAVAQAEQNATAAYELSFQQYQRGLVNYATVLQAEQRAFDASFNLLDLRFQLIINYIDLNTALGGGELS